MEISEGLMKSFQRDITENSSKWEVKSGIITPEYFELVIQRKRIRCSLCNAVWAMNCSIPGCPNDK